MSKEYFSTESVWSASIRETEDFGPLPGDMDADVVVIGAGITGISTAYLLAAAGLEVIVLESGKTGKGTTGSSTGNLYIPTAQFQSIVSKNGTEGLNAVVTARSAGLHFIEDRINEFGIECAFKKVPWYYFTQKKSNVKEIEKEHKVMSSAGLKVADAFIAGFPFDARAISRLDSQAQINPLQYVQKLAAAIYRESCRIYEDTKVLEIKDGNPCIVSTTHGTLKAKYVVQATHTPKGIYAAHAMMEVYREMAVAAKLKSALPEDGIYWDYDGTEKYSVRTYNSPAGPFLIVLDNSYKTGQKERNETGFKKIEKYIKKIFDVEEISYMWAAQMYKPADYLPFIGNSPLQKNVFIATGFSADGLVYGTAAAIIISDLITGISNPVAKVFDPKRFGAAVSTKTLKENIDVTAHLISDYILKGYEEELSGIRMGESRIVEYNKQKAAAYRDHDGVLHVVSAVCTHLGCLVHWNNAEKSWDCPCHGSRFSYEGKLLEGPAINDLQKYLTGKV
ncbi:MAG TPA: FAD-dependent oxidoreductase [Bacteroidales bacterium]|nr:FAD-dependent oxidoreductase [Bacteroidales bacterium]